PFEGTSVHTEETSVQLPKHLSYGEELRLKYPSEWDATRDAYALWDLDDGGTRLDRLEECRTYAWFMGLMQTYEHNHEVQVLSDSHDHQAGTDVQNHFPPWYCLAYIMKL
ncbi:unnamed protein product, partial [marine sediment metagenome]